MSEEIVKSPCVLICVLDENDVCEGCYRSAQEITDWSVLSMQERRAVLVNVNDRYRQLNKHLLL